MSPHLVSLSQRCPSLTPHLEEIQKAFEIICESYQKGGTLYLCGNGGSGADCEHFSGELLKGFAQKRPLSSLDQSKLSPSLLRNSKARSLPSP